MLLQPHLRRRKDSQFLDPPKSNKNYLVNLPAAFVLCVSDLISLTGIVSQVLAGVVDAFF